MTHPAGHQAKAGAAKRAGKRMVGALYWRIRVEADACGVLGFARIPDTGAPCVLA